MKTLGVVLAFLTLAYQPAVATSTTSTDRPSAAIEALRAGRQLEERGDYSSAARLYQQALEKTPDPKLAQRLVGCNEKVIRRQLRHRTAKPRS